MAKVTPAHAPTELRHRSVPDMVRDLLADDPDFATEFETRLSNRQLVKSLAVIRTRAGLSQQELAAKMACSQSKISKLESGTDSDLKFGDITGYLEATGHKARIFLVPGGGTIVDEVKMHAFRIKHLLDGMVELASSDGAITKGVAAFIEEAACNLTRFTKMAAAALPKLPPEPSRSVQVETPELDFVAESPAPEPPAGRRSATGC